MLTQRERRELAAIEAMLTAEDPHLAEALRGACASTRQVVQRTALALFGFAAVVAGACGLGPLLYLVGILGLLAASAPEQVLGQVLGHWARWPARRSSRRTG